MPSYIILLKSTLKDTSSTGHNYIMERLLYNICIITQSLVCSTLDYGKKSSMACFLFLLLASFLMKPRLNGLSSTVVY